MQNDCDNHDIGDTSMKFGAQLEHVFRKIFGYGGISDLTFSDV